ncbi:FAD linked oxidases, C-terminal domain [Musa troglodytarum]|uniref:D-lactate dehydrogenase (cytochrome) n=1 Tax=Musa troglodytarum TaxID=320322 RepID=A0A9E7KJA3_9LILI|nr:FAD linked oxidases, C-terminal domain [Musa troglodytarum]
MAFLSTFFSRIASKPHLRRPFRASLPPGPTQSPRSGASGDRLLAWSSAFVRFAVAAGAALAFDLHPVAVPSLCDPGIDLRYSASLPLFGLVSFFPSPFDNLEWIDLCLHGCRVGGKDSTELVVKGARREAPKEFIQELKDFLQDNLTVDYEERCFHGKPQNSFHRSVNVPDVVVFPRSQDDVQKIVAACNKYKVPIVPYGGATSIEGHTLAPHGGVCIDMSLMKKIKSLNVEDLDIVLEPGIGWIELNEYLKPYGLFFPLDPGPGATIGGMCATRCSGSLAVRYGTMRDNVINLQVVLANGEVIKTGSRARKSAAGYDLTRLLIGSEGTLGIITEVTLRLQRLPQHSVVAMCNFQTIKDAADVAIATMLSSIQVWKGINNGELVRRDEELCDDIMILLLKKNVRHMETGPHANAVSSDEIASDEYILLSTVSAAQPEIYQVNVMPYVSRMELLDEVQVKAINIANGKNLPEVPTLMFEFIGTEAYAREQTLIVQKIVSEHNGSDFVYVENADDKEELWKIRKEALWACYAMAPNNFEAMTTLLLPGCLTCCIGALSMVIAHAGDGNFHTIIMFDPEQEEQRQEAERLNHFMVHTALSLEGTCTGEHGVGTGKMKYLEKELGSGALRTMKRIKSVLDPNDIMNPGKLIPPHVCI